jgi:hypothetical protein
MRAIDMATKVASRKSRLSSDNEESKTAPAKHWWQWLLLYPSFAVALLTAGPQWYDRINGYMLGVASASQAEKQAQLWQKNASCVGLNSNGYLSPRRIAVDATICNSGDILVRAITPERNEIYRWLALDDIVRKESSGRLIPTAEAASLMFNQSAIQVALLQTVICTKTDGRYLTRRVQTPEGCFDEVIDTYTGALVSRKPAPCTPQC